MQEFFFDVELMGVGNTPEEAWNDAIEGFALDPGEPLPYQSAETHDWLISGGPSCPNCGADTGEIEYDDLEFDGSPWQNAECSVCGSTWTEVYKLDSLENLVRRNNHEQLSSNGLYQPQALP